MKSLAFSAGILAVIATGFAPDPALAQAGQGTLVIFGNDPCPRENICVRAPESYRYRMPASFRESGTLQQSKSWSKKSKALMSVGNTGVGSCSAVGPGGQTGCLIQSINEARTQTRQTAEDNKPPQ